MGKAKALTLISVLMQNPAEFRDRLAMMVGARLPLLPQHTACYVPSDLESVVAQLSAIPNRDLPVSSHESELLELEASVRRRVESLPPDAPFRTVHNGDMVLARICYTVVRQLRPCCVVETGVCYGVTSAFILAALDRNQRGDLHSIDLPPLGPNGSRFVGWAIPENLRKRRWHLHRGLSAKILPRLLQQIGSVEVFLHDSLHTYKNMQFEFRLAWPCIPPGGVLISDDIDGNAAFKELATGTDVAYHAAIRESQKDSLLGIAVKQVATA